jgi:hypothetical protein
VTFTKGECEVWDSSGRLMARAESSGGLYWFYAKALMNRVLISNELDSPLDLWHRRLGHLHEGMVKRMVSEVRLGNQKLSCVPCIQGKMARAQFPKSKTSSAECFSLIHSDVCGPLPIESRFGHRYFVTFIDDKSWFCFLYLLQSKSEVIIKFKEF